MIRCNNCWWHGEEKDLKIFVDFTINKDEVIFYKGCPNCKTDIYLVDLR